MKARTLIMAAAVLSMATGIAWAGDNLQVTVSGGSPTPTQKVNGNQAIQGTIQLWYTVNSFTFPVGNFGSFSISMQDAHLTGTNNAVYSAPLTIQQNGSEDLVLSPDQTDFTITGVGWTGSTTVHISIPAGVSNADGTDIVGNLHISVPGTNHVATPTSVQVHILLVHPTACLKVYNFVTDEGFTGILSSITVNLAGPLNQVKSSDPGQFSYNVLIVNTCGTTFVTDLGIALDSRWETNPHNGHGNPVSTYSTAGVIDPSTFNILTFGSSTPAGHLLCLQNVAIPTSTTFLAAVHSEVIKDLSATVLGTAPFIHTAALRQANTGCTGAYNSTALPNPASTTLPFTTN
jgi:hypothetical protein